MEWEFSLYVFLNCLFNLILLEEEGKWWSSFNLQILKFLSNLFSYVLLLFINETNLIRILFHLFFLEYHINIILKFIWNFQIISKVNNQLFRPHKVKDNLADVSLLSVDLHINRTLFILINWVAIDVSKNALLTRLYILLMVDFHRNNEFKHSQTFLALFKFHITTHSCCNQLAWS